jgi:hypothetical protein
MTTVDDRARAALDALMPVDEEGRPANEAGAATVREYLTAILAQTVFEDPPKRMWGTSDWLFQAFAALVKAELVRGTFDEDGYLDELDTAGAEALLRDAANALAQLPEPVNPPPLDHQVEVLTSLVAHQRQRLEFIERGADYERNNEPGMLATPGQTWAWLLNATADERLTWIDNTCTRADEGIQCFIRNHERIIAGLRERVRTLEQRVTELGGELR